MEIFVTQSEDKKGFSIVEVLIGLGMLSMGVVIIAALSQQVMNLAKSGKQTAAILELRNTSSQITRNPTQWLQKMKGSSGLFASCIDSSLTSFSCPAPNNNLAVNDEELRRHLGTMNIIDAPVVNAMGDKIAGTLAEPHYMDAEGRPCDNATTCALKSTGYFMRENPSTTGNPGSVKFVIKIEKNPDAVGEYANGTPMKAQYVSMLIGEDWKHMSSAEECATGTIKIGYLSNGTPQCINPTASCPSGQVQIGIDSSAQPLCQVPPSTCAPGEVVVLNSSTGALACSGSSNCPTGIFAGYFSATGQAMCLANPPCTHGVQIGQESNGAPKCVNIPSCTGTTPHLSFNGSNFSCLASVQSPIIPKTCEDGSYVKGISPDGGVICAPLRGIAGLDGQDGSAGQSGRNGTDGKDAPELTCKITDRKSTGDSWNTVCCDTPVEVAVAGETPEDPGDSSMRWNTKKPHCMDVSRVGSGNLVQLRCCQVSVATKSYKITRSIAATTRQTQIKPDQIFDCGQPYEATVESLKKTSDFGNFNPKQDGKSRIIFEHPSGHQNLKITADVVVQCTPK